MRAHEQVLVHGPAGTVRFACSPAEQAAAIALLDRAEAALGAPLVDEQERARLDRLAHHDGDQSQHWHLLLAWPHPAEADRAHEPTGYAGVQVLPGQPATGEVVRGHDGATSVLELLLDASRQVAGDHDAGELTVWARHAADDVLEVAGRTGWHVQRRLLVLGHDLDASDRQPHLPDGIELGHHDRSMDAEIAELLRLAYAGTADGDWDLATLQSRLALPWFRSQDLLVARDTGRIVAVHWTKRRDARTGEVYNLAVHPDARGRGLGAGMLDAGLAHLAADGARHVVLWVDAANEAGLALYAGRGFTRQWQDVALVAATG